MLPTDEIVTDTRNALKWYLEGTGISQSTMAMRLSVSKGYMSEFLNAKRSPEYETLYKWVRFLLPLVQVYLSENPKSPCSLWLKPWVAKYE